MSVKWLQVKKGSQLVANVRLTGERLVLGRAPECDVVLSGDGVSRQHVELIAKGDDWSVRDLGSRNGILVNGARKADAHVVRPGDRVQLDIFDLTIKEDTPVPPPQMRARPLLPMTDGANYGVVKTMHQMAPPKLEAKHLSTLLSFSGELLATAELADRQRGLCNLMIGKDFHGTAAVLLRVRRGEAEAAPEPLGEPLLAPGSEAPHVSRSLMQAVVASETAVLAASRPMPPAGGQDVVKMSVAASSGAKVAAVACPLQVGEATMDVLYVMLPGAYGTAEWLALANMACALFRQAEDVWAARAVAEKQLLLEEEQRRAQDLQERLVPEDFRLGRLDIAFGFAACKGVGGDYVDAVQMADGRVLLAAMDVAGKGMDAALIASGLHTSVHMCAAHGLGLVDMVKTLNRYLIGTWDTFTSVTVAASILDPRTGQIESLNCSHPNPVIVGADGRVRDLKAFESVPLGLTDFPIEVVRDRLAPGELLAYYSDGLSELFDERDEMLQPDGVNLRLSQLRGEARGAPAPDLVVRLQHKLAEYRGKALPSDDVSFILVLVG